MSYLPGRKAAERLGLHPQTLRRYARQRKIPFYRNAGGQRPYDVDAFLRGEAGARDRLLLPGQLRQATRSPSNVKSPQIRELYPDAQVCH